MDGQEPYLPEDPEFYVQESRLAKMPELDLWEFCEKQSDKAYLDYSFETGANLDKDYIATPLTTLNINAQEWLDWALANKASCQKKYYECRPYHTGINKMAMDLPSTVGYNHRNTVEYNWGLYAETREQLKELLGGRPAFEQMGMDYDTALPRFMIYMPGNTLPWHFDTLNGWCREFEHLNPRMADGEDIKSGRAKEGQNICDIGYIKRYLVMVNDWHWGHMLQMDNSFFPRWKSGEVYDIPAGVYHLSANNGLTLKMTCNISGVSLF
jgi:hypothetical protein